MNKTANRARHALPLLHILFILFIGGIGVQTLTSCSSGGGGTNDDDPIYEEPIIDPNDGNTATYTGTADGATYTLNITPNTPGGGNNTLNGTWVSSDDGDILVLNNGNFTMSEYNIELIKGTYSTNGSNLTLTPTQVSGALFEDDASTLGLSTSEWYTQSQLRAAIIQAIVNLGYSQSEAEILYNTTPDLSGLFAPQTASYTLSGSSLTVTAWGGTSIFIRTGDALVGDSYVLTVKESGTTKTSTGTVTTEAGTLKLKPSNSETTFNVTVNASGGITNISGPITFIDGQTLTINTTLTPGKGSGGSSSSVGGGRSSSSGGGSNTIVPVTIGNQVWMKHNLNINVPGSKCYDDNPANCAKYGRLYDWETAKTVCPSGWHLPSNDDWDELLRWVDERNGGDGLLGRLGTGGYGSDIAGQYLKASSGWFSDGSGTDKYGFSALPGGYFQSNDALFKEAGFNYAGDYGFWWSSSEEEDNADGDFLIGDEAYGFHILWYLDYAYRTTYDKSDLLSVRCIQD